MIFWVFGFPLLMTIGLGLAFRSTPPSNPRVVVVADAPSALASALLEDTQLEATRLPDAEGRQALAQAKCDVLVDLRDSQPIYRYDPKLPSARLARVMAEASLERAAGRQDLLSGVDQQTSAPGTRYVDFLIPGLIGMNIMGSSLWSIGYSLVVARKRKLLKRYAVTAMRRSDFILSYFLARGVFLAAELVVLIAFGALVFGTVVQGSLLALVALSVMGSATFAGLGLIIGGRVESTEVAQGWMNFVQLPMWVLSGLFFSNETFPDWLQPVIRVLPLTALVDGLRMVFNQGADLIAIAGQFGILACWAVLGFGVSHRGFRWQ
jgi:ABC-type multidrug transport system permease subunit